MGETQEKWVTHHNGWSPHLKCPLQLKTKEDIGGISLVPQRAGKQFTRRWKSRCLINKCLLCHTETIWDNENFNKQILLGFSQSTHLVHTIVFFDDSSLPRTALATFFRQLEGLSKFLPESFGCCFQLKIICMPKRHFGVTGFAPKE